MKDSSGQEKIYDVIIVGGAAAGLTAALYCARRTLHTLVLTKSLGGQAAMTPAIENYPGTKKIAGVDLMLQFQNHAKSYGAQFAYETVTSLTKEKEVFTVKTTTGQYMARAVILAFGLTPRNLEVPGEQGLQGKGVVYCATCDAPLFKGKDVAVVGGTFEALDAALLLARMHCRVTLVHEKDGYPTHKKLFEQVQQNPQIQLRMNSAVVRVEGTQKVEAVVIHGKEAAEEERIPVAGVFVEKGHKIDSAWVGDLVEFDKQKAILISLNNETKTPGLFAAGDVTPLRDKQVVISAGEGAKAALSAYHYLQKQSGKPVLLVDWKHSEE
ncbi:MAG: FAD-dependent oxidoreductase [Candidatus Kerfeldbacteria bacterium]|nr:FAD-dependent oxidoreductase [Candidatus Kerfeldbacteria bacterium]